MRTTLALFLGLGLSACGGSDDTSETSDTAVVIEADDPEDGGRETRDRDEMPTPDSPREFVRAYETLLGDMTESLREIETPEEARELAADFAADVERMQELGDQFEGENGMVLATAYAARAAELSLLNRDLMLEMVRIQADPDMAEAFNEALVAFERGN
ncbi:MAG: hypothetical protein MJB57_02965 [Gemmatimonadetes bacterium]|nr:hypothetical protein [Gemmatimonadota bacterium]